MVFLHLVRLSIGVSKPLGLELGRLEEAAIAFCGEFKVDKVVGNDLIDAGADALHGDGVPLALDGEHSTAMGLSL